jgi:hypothetical protein
MRFPTARRCAARTAFEPDALVYCGPRLPPHSIEIPDPIIVVEVLSEGTAARQLAGYFSLPGVAHYLIFDAENRTAIHHKRGLGDMIETRILKEGPLRLDPPGLEIPVEAMSAPVFPHPNSLSVDERASKRPVTEESPSVTDEGSAPPSRAMRRRPSWTTKILTLRK